MSNMSTKIEDLPGGPIEEEEIYISEPQKDISKYNENSNIQVDIVKKEQVNNKSTKPFSLTNEIRSQINEENALLFVIFIVFTTTRINSYLGNVPGISRFINNEMSLVLLKSGLAVLTFVILKRFVLNKFSL